MAWRKRAWGSRLKHRLSQLKRKVNANQRCQRLVAERCAGNITADVRTLELHFDRTRKAVFLERDVDTQGGMLIAFDLGKRGARGMCGEV